MQRTMQRGMHNIRVATSRGATCPALAVQLSMAVHGRVRAQICRKGHLSQKTIASEYAKNPGQTESPGEGASTPFATMRNGDGAGRLPRWLSAADMQCL